MSVQVRFELARLITSLFAQGNFTAALRRSPFACLLRTRMTTLIGRDIAPPYETLNILLIRDPVETAVVPNKVCMPTEHGKDSPGSAWGALVSLGFIFYFAGKVGCI